MNSSGLFVYLFGSDEDRVLAVVSDSAHCLTSPTGVSHPRPSVYQRYRYCYGQLMITGSLVTLVLSDLRAIIVKMRVLLPSCLSILLKVKLPPAVVLPETACFYAQDPCHH